jgi:predicted DNA binding CopG/RHH family protein
MNTKKSTFKKENPALSFMTPPEEAIVDVKRKEAPEGYKVNPEFIETKSKRVQLLLQPSTVDAIKALATRKGLSMNEAINEAIQEYIKRED